MRKFTFLLLFLLTLSAGYGQLVANYTFSQSTGNVYTEITGGTQVVGCTGCTESYDSSQYVITLPSSFPFNGVPISSVAMRVDGSLVLGVTAVPSNAVTPISATTTATGVIAALGGDQRATQIAGVLYELRWEEVGNEFVFQWKNSARWLQATAEKLNYQVRINKTTGVINIAYGSMDAVTNSTSYQPQVGLRGAAATDFNARNLTATVPTATPSWENTAAATTNGATVRFTSASPAAFPASGLTFTYSPPSCFAPSGLTATLPTQNGITLGWTASLSAPASGYDYYISEVNTAPVAATAATGNQPTGLTATVGSLNPGTAYFVWVRSACSESDKSLWIGPVAFNTAQIPTPMPFNENFEGTNSFALVNGAEANKWFAGTFVNNGGTKSLYVSNTAAGTNNDYAHTTSTVHAYRDIAVQAGMTLAELKFDYKAGGESIYDYVRIWATPTTYSPVAGTQTTVALGGAGTVMVADFQNLTGGAFVPKLFYVPVTAFAGQSVRLIFEWKNDSGGGVQTAGAIDNVVFAEPACYPPAALVASALHTGVTFSWTAPAVAPAGGYDVYYGIANTAPTASATPSVSVATGTSATVTTLPSDVLHYYWVRSVCDATNKSGWIYGGTFLPQCAAVVPTVTENFTSYTGAMPVPACWREASGALGTSVASTALTNGSSWTNGTYNNATGHANGTAALLNLYGTDNEWIISPAIDLGTALDYQLEYTTSIIPWSGSATVTQLGEKSVRVLISTDAGATWTAANTLKLYNQSNIPAGGVNEVISLAAYTGVIKIAFYANSTTTDQDLRLYVDNFRIREIPQCMAPTALQANNPTSNTVSLVWTAPSAAPAAGYQYYVGLNNTAPAAGATPTGSAAAGVTTASPTLVPSTTYFVWVRSNCGVEGFSEWTGPVTFTTQCEYPELLSSAATALCGQGTSTLTATSSGGTIQWYAAQTGGAPLAEGGTFTSPVLTETTTYYVGTKGASSDISVGPASPTAQGGTIGNQTVAWNVNFTVSAGTVLKTVDVFPQTAGQAFAIAVRTSGGTVITNYPFTTSVGGGATAQTVTLGHALVPGSYQLYITLPSGGLSRNTTGAVYPYTSTVANITGNGYDPAYFMCFYNWVFDSACYSPRTAVVVNVTDAPAIAADVTEEVICAGESTDLSVTSANAGYAYVWMPGNLAGAAQTVSPAATTTYTVTATDTVSGCVETATVTVTVNALPVIPAMNDMEVCEGGIQALSFAGAAGTVTSGTATGTSALANTGATLGPNPLQNFYGGAKQQWIYTAAELTAMGMVAGSNINSIGLNLATSGPEALNGMVIKMKNTTVSAFASTTAWIADMVTVKTSFNHTSTTGVNTFALTTPFVWDGTSNLAIQMSYSNNDSPDTADATNTARYSATSFVSTIYYRADSTTATAMENYTGTASYTYSQRNDVTFNFGTPTQTVWTPVTNLYTDAAATVPYAGGNAGTVYTKPVAAITYTATATNLAGCSLTDQVAITIKVVAAPTVTEAAQTLCGGSTVANIAATGTGLKWYTASTGGTALAATAVLTDNTTYYASQTVDGCESVARTAVAITITTVAAPTVDDATQEFCNSATVAGLAATGTAIKWYDEATGGAALEATVALTNGGTYYASQTVAGCESTARTLVTVTINTPAAPTATATLTVCNAGTVANLEATGTAGATIAWYDEATGGTALAATVALTNGGTYYASQTIEGCESVQRTLVTVTINTPAEPTVAATQTFCDAATVADLEATGVAGAAIAWYEEATGGVALEGTVALTNGGTYYASQTVTGCESTVRALVTVTISTVATPVATVTQPTCAVATGTIVVTAPVGGEYTYSIDGTTFQAETTFSAVAPGTYTVTAKNANDCVATAAVTVNAAPEVPATPVTALTQPTCAVATGTIVVTAPIADANTYSIDGTTFGPSSTFENVAPGTYTVTVQNAAGCTATATVVINDAPAVPDAPTGDETQTITVGTAEEATIEDIIVTAAGTVTWYPTAQDAIDGTDALAAGTQLTNGSTYYGTQTVGECTSEYIAVLIDLVLGKDDFGRNAFSVYPNPVKDILNISYTAEITSVTVHNLLGQQVIATQPNATEVKIDLSGLAEATYIVNVTAGNTVKTIKVVKK